MHSFITVKCLLKVTSFQKNHDKVKKMIEKRLKFNHESEYSFLYGKLLKNEKKYSEAKIELENSIRSGNGEAMYE